jgi:acyl transferase domain-containing protein/3-hydroxymyristoyl/3-hydroxydecanoyl-(acyl carrier protein) dehydratase
MTKRPPIAVVGMAGLFPGASDLPMFWRNIVAKFDANREVPPNRWIADAKRMVSRTPAPDKALHRRGCFIDPLTFDPAGFDLPPDLLQDLDPMYHMVLSVGQTAISEPTPVRLNRKRTGVVLAAIALPTDAASTLSRNLIRRLVEQQLFGSAAYRLPSEAQRLAARVTSLPATLLARALELGGGAFTLDAACASSLYAVKLACDELAAQRADAMLAGGVARPDCLYTQVGFSQLKALSPSGRCAPFDRSADGLVVGEGAGILVLKRLEDALTDNDRVYGLIRGIGLSNDMRGNLLAPDSDGQLRAMRMAYASVGWSPSTVDLIECHGAGTPVGDVTELRSLRVLWKPAAGPVGRCAIGSVKSMIGHLLTAAGAAGMIKTLLALNEKILPPSLNFQHPPEGSPLIGSPFRVQTAAEQWPERSDGCPRRAAVSAFGFGGINAHVLLEEWPSGRPAAGCCRPIAVTSDDVNPRAPASAGPKTAQPVAVIGMSVAFGPITSLPEFQETVFNGRSIIADRPAERWKGCDDMLARSGLRLPRKGGFMRHLSIDTSEFRIPPKEIPDILPQHLLMLKVAAAAMADAGLAEKTERPRMGVVIGLAFDYEATNFHLRWSLFEQVRQWRLQYYPKLDDKTAEAWCAALQEIVSPPLTASRTLGALGGIVASRVAREFHCGGPSFSVSAEAAAGNRALEIGVRLLQQQEVDAVLVGAVDLAADIRQILCGRSVEEYSRSGSIRPFDRGADGTLPGEGAAAVVLKRLDQARTEKERIYAAVIGIGNAGGRPDDAAAAETYARALRRALKDADLPASRIDFVETLGSGIPSRDRREARALQAVFADRNTPCVLGATLPNLGHTGAAAGLASIVKAALCLRQGVFPPLPSCHAPAEEIRQGGVFTVPTALQSWFHDRIDGPRRSCVGLVTGDGNSCAVVLEEASPRLEDISPAALHPTPRSAGVESPAGETMEIPVGGRVPTFVAPPGGGTVQTTPQPDSGREEPAQPPRQNPPFRTSTGSQTQLIEAFTLGTTATAAAHNRFLDFSDEIGRACGENAVSQIRLIEALVRGGSGGRHPRPAFSSPAPGDTRSDPIAFTRDQCLEFATGRAASVLGPEFAAVDTYPTRVRLPGEPLMLVDRIVSITGRQRSLTTGNLVTEHDVQKNAWYLDGDRAPVCIAVEAGQADLFLCAYLGIDLAVKGRRVYRLLDAGVVFHRDLPRVGETIRYRIEIDKFIRQADTWLFFFGFEGTIDNQPLISMTGGCAGFFTAEEIERSGGIVRRAADGRPQTGRRDPRWKTLVPQAAASFDDAALEALRSGDLAAGFGPSFEGVSLTAALRLPGGRMQLIDRVQRLEPCGGRFGLGSIRAEADIHPDDWFLTCHFVDDMTMPGTLMYECCAHALRVFLQRLGWVTDRPGVHYAPVPGIKSVLQCRGPVTPRTRRVIYEVEIKEIGYGPEPYALADAHMYADGRYIVRFTDMSLRMVGIDRETIEDFWAGRRRNVAGSDHHRRPPVLFGRQKLLAFATGNPSEAFGEPYAEFDNKRFLARLPAPPYAFIDRVVKAEPRAWELKPGGWVEAEVDIDPAAWYFRANRSDRLPYGVLLETALQACGWLAAYAGSALHSCKDLHFRNLDGQAVQHLEVPAVPQTLTVRCRMTKASASGDIIIESFDFEVLCRTQLVYEGSTVFGFFTAEDLSNQKGIQTLEEETVMNAADEGPAFEPVVFSDEAPLTPEDPHLSPVTGLSLPAKALRMIDRITAYRPQGGSRGLGWLCATKRIDPAEWFFKAHFHQDPVCPGSLGIESLLQLLKYAAIRRWPHLVTGHRFEHPVQAPHTWQYRGQIVPGNRLAEVEATITTIIDEPTPELRADGLLRVDGLVIYRMKNFGLRILKI